MSAGILIITTGGTIVSLKSEEGASPDAQKTSDMFNKAENYFSSYGISCSLCRIFGDTGYDSSDIGPEQWLIITDAVKNGILAGFSGIIILHGTDTMAYTSAWLSIIFKGVNIPIVITGSQRTPDSADFDGDFNLFGAADFVRERNCGVWLFFNGKAYYGDRVHKADSSNIDAFTGVLSSINTNEKLQNRCPVMSSVDTFETMNILTYISGIKRQSASTEIACCRIVPGVAVNLSGHESILIIEGFGTGNMPQFIHGIIEEKYSAGKKPQIIACSQAEHGIRDPLAYSRVGIGELARKGFLVWNQGDYPIEFILALSHYALLSSAINLEVVIQKYLLKVKIKD